MTAAPSPSVRVLVVDDSPLVREGIRAVLEGYGREAGLTVVGEAASVAEALTRAAQDNPDLVLMDIRLPDMDGVEALSRLRMDERTAAIPVLAVTAQAMKGDSERFKEAGFDGYLSKPVDIDELLTTVEQHCRGRGG